jgi:hypothetical protein
LPEFLPRKNIGDMHCFENNVARCPLNANLKSQVGRGFSPDGSGFQTDVESTQLVGAEAPTHLNHGKIR